MSDHIGSRLSQGSHLTIFKPVRSRSGAVEVVVDHRIRTFSTPYFTGIEYDIEVIVQCEGKRVLC